MTDISIAILVGGKSTRFERRKQLLDFGGSSLLRTIYDRLRPLSDDVFLQGSLTMNGARTNRDMIEGAGPIGGIYSALNCSLHDRVVVIASDMPFLDARLLDVLKREKDAKLVVPRWKNGFTEPLASLYTRSLIPQIEEMLRQGEFQISKLFEKVESVRWLVIEDLIRKGVITEDCFYNINEPQDWSRIGARLDFTPG